MQNTNEKSVFTKCLSTLGIDEVKKLLVHYFIKVVDLKESSLESDDLIAKLDVRSFINKFIIFPFIIWLLLNNCEFYKFFRKLVIDKSILFLH